LCFCLLHLLQLLILIHLLHLHLLILILLNLVVSFFWEQRIMVVKCRSMMNDADP
jgi:hypothetical protein